MKKLFVNEIIIAILIAFFIYTSVSKLIDLRSFRMAMFHQPFPAWFNNTLTYTLPAVELLIALALGFTKTRHIALFAYAVLMIAFTGYTALVIFHYYKNTPCGCGGIINHLSWEGHFIINSTVLSLALISIFLTNLINTPSFDIRKNFMHNQEASRKPVTE